MPVQAQDKFTTGLNLSGRALEYAWRIAITPGTELGRADGRYYQNAGPDAPVRRRAVGMRPGRTRCP